MKRTRVFVSAKFFDALYPFSADPINGNGMLIRACASQGRDGSVLRSKEFLLFGYGIATLLPWLRTSEGRTTDGFVMEFTQKVDVRQVRYWEVNIAANQDRTSTDWELKVSFDEPDSSVRMLIAQPGVPGQYFYLT